MKKVKLPNGASQPIRVSEMTLLKHIMDSLKVVSATFLLLCFIFLKESNCETRKNAFYFTSKTLFVFEIIKF